MPTNIDTLLKMNLDDLDFSRAIKLIKSCGKLASRILRDEVYRSAKQPSRPVFLKQIGLCEVLVTIPTSENSVLRDAAIIPFQWKKIENDGPPSPPIPKNLKPVVLSVKQVIAQYANAYFTPDKIAEIDILELVPKSDDIRFDGEWDSAWASLAAGLMQKLENIGAECNVFTTGCYDGQIMPVGGVEKKITVAKEFGANKVFVPKDNLEEARNIVERSKTNGPICWKNFEILALENEADPFLALKDFRIQSRLKPVGFQNNDFSDFQNYYLKTTQNNRNIGQQYFIDELIPAILHYDREKAEKWRKIIVGGFTQPITYFTVISNANEVIHLVRQLLPDEKYMNRLVIVCFGDEFKEKAKEIERLDARIVVEENVPESKIWNEINDSFIKLLKKYTVDEDSNIVCDLTQGDKLMSLSLYTTARQLTCNHRMIYWPKKMLNGIIFPDTLEVEELTQVPQ